MNSEAHRNALLKVLNKSHAPNNTNPQELEQNVGHILVTNIITFVMVEDWIATLDG